MPLLKKGQEKRMVRVLFLTNLAPSPLDNGGKIFVNSLIKCLKMREAEVDLFCYHDPKDSKINVEEMKKLSANYVCIERNLIASLHKKSSLIQYGCSLFSKYSVGLYKFYSRAMKNSLINAMKSKEYDYIFLGCLAVCPFIKYFRKYNPKAKVILCEQNCEAVINERRIERTGNPLARFLLKCDLNKLKKCEKAAIFNSDKVFLLSKDDLSNIMKITKHEFPHEIISIGFENKPAKKHYSDEIKKLLFVGTLSWEPNNDGLIWFINNVMPTLDESITLTIIGRGASNELIEVCKEHENVKLEGYVDSLDAYYDNCDAAIVPLFIGSGQRVKIIDSFSRGMPVVATSIGAEGIDYKNEENIFIADDVENMKRIIENPPQSLEKIGKNALVTFNKTYSIEAICKKVWEAIK